MRHHRRDCVGLTILGLVAIVLCVIAKGCRP